MAYIIDGMPPCAKIRANCAWDRPPICWPCSTTRCGDCSLGAVPPIWRRRDGNLPISLTKLCMSWQAKKDFRECNSPEAGGPGNGFSRRAGMHRLMRFTVQKTFEVDGNLS